MLGSSKQIAELQDKINKLEADLSTATEGKASLETELGKAKADLQTALDKSVKLDADLLDLKAKLELADKSRLEAEEKAKKAEASIQTEVNTRLAAAGVDPIARDPGAAETQDGTKPKADASLPPRQRATAAMGAWKVFGKN